MATNQGESYIDVLVKLFTSPAVGNFHLLAIPLREWHTEENMCNVVSFLLFSVDGTEWDKKVVGISTDRASSMVGDVPAAVTRLQRQMLPGVYRVWCGAHRLGLAVHDASQRSVKERFQGPLYSLIGYLRRQASLKADMRNVCFTVPTTR